MMAERTRPAAIPTADDGAAVRCLRCRTTLAIRGDDGQLWIRHREMTVLIEGLTRAQRVRIWCARCTKEQEVAA